MDLENEIFELTRRIYKQESPFETVDVTYADARTLATWHVNQMHMQRSEGEQVLLQQE
jgi:hypothetical protein